MSNTGLSALARLSTEGFFLAFFSALKVRGLKFIDVRDDAHYRRFDRVAARIISDEKAAEKLPIDLYPSPYDGRYRELDDALLTLQRGAMGARNPTYPGVEILIPLPQARNELQQLGTAGAKFISTLADQYLSQPKSST